MIEADSSTQRRMRTMCMSSFAPHRFQSILNRQVVMSGRTTGMRRRKEGTMAVNFYRLILFFVFLSVGYVLSAEKEINQDVLLSADNDTIVNDEVRLPVHATSGESATDLKIK